MNGTRIILHCNLGCKNTQLRIHFHNHPFSNTHTKNNNAQLKHLKQMGVSKNRGENPQNGRWKSWKTLLKWMIWGVKNPQIFGSTPQITQIAQVLSIDSQIYVYLQPRWPNLRLHTCRWKHHHEGPESANHGPITYWLVVEPTHLKNMLVKMGSSSPNRGENKKYLSCHHLAYHKWYISKGVMKST